MFGWKEVETKAIVMVAYRSKLTPYPHQEAALAKMDGRRVFALTMAMRTGKTKVLLDNFGMLEFAGEVKDLLVIAPAGVYKTWEGEIEKHLSDDLLTRLDSYIWASAQSQLKMQQLLQEQFLASTNPRILLMNVEALSSVKRARAFCEAFLRDPDMAMIAIDECFVAGTKIMTLRGDIAIEDVLPGDMVASSKGWSRVARVLRKRSCVLAKIKLSNGKTIRVTPNHPFFTDVGWVCAGNLTKGRTLHDAEALSMVWKKVASQTIEEILQQILLSEMACTSAMVGRSLHRTTEFKDQENKNEERHLALIPGRMEPGHPDARVISQKIERSTQSDRSQTEDNWRQRSAVDQASKEIIEDVRLALDTGVSHRIGRKAARLSYQLQSGSWQSNTQVSDRMRWRSTQRSLCASEARKESGQIGRVWVESVTIEKLGRAVDVFDLELEGTPHFFAEGVLVHNSTAIKSIKAQRTKYINKYLKPRAIFRRILSGLPTPRSPLDLYAQFEFLDQRILGFNSYYGMNGFLDRYAVIREQRIGGRIIKLIIGYRNVEELQRKIEPHSYRVEFRPNIPSTYTIREVSLTDEQIRIYNEIKTYATAKLEAEAHVTATVVVAQILRLHQVLCGHVSDEQGNLHQVPENKTTQLLEILDDYNGKAVIWCSYDYNINAVVAALRTEYGEQSVARFWGGNVKTREAEEREFKTNPECRFMVATPAAGGWGRTWPEADLVIYYSSTYNLEHREQSEQRVQGVSKEKQVDYIDLIAPNTVETKILNVLRRKLDMAATITGDAWKEWLI